MGEIKYKRDKVYVLILLFEEFDEESWLVMDDSKIKN